MCERHVQYWIEEGRDYNGGQHSSLSREKRVEEEEEKTLSVKAID